MEMSKKIIFLDLDETLIDTSNRHYQVYCDLMKILNLKNPIDKEEFWKLKRNGISTVEILDEKDPKAQEEFINLWIKNIENKEYLILDKLFSETQGLLSKLSKETLILLTMRNNRDNLIWELKKLGLYDIFETILSCSPLKNKDKTAPILEYINDKNLDIDKNSIIVGDSEIDIITGKKLNMTTIAVSYGIRKEDKLLSMNPDYCLEDIKEVVDTLNNI